jgi:hypothetical protein
MPGFVFDYAGTSRMKEVDSRSVPAPNHVPYYNFEQATDSNK